MYSRTSKNHHFLPRRGSYSTHPQKNGRVDVLPPDARESIYAAAEQLAALDERLNLLNIKKDDLHESLHRAQRLQQLQDKLTGSSSQNTISGIRREVEIIEIDIRRVKESRSRLLEVISPSKKVTLETAFYNLARVELSEEVFQRLSIEASRIVARSGSKSRK
jgi:hypothetical protein